MVEVYDMSRGKEFFGTDNVFNTEMHGDYLLSPTQATITNEYSGQNTLNVTCNIKDYFNKGKKIFDVGSIVRVDVLPTRFYHYGWRETDSVQLYSIYAVNLNNYEVSFSAEPIMNRLEREKYAIDVRPTNMGVGGAWNYFVGNAFGTPLMKMGFTGSGAGADNNTAYYIDKNLLEATQGTDDNCLLQRWGAIGLPDNQTMRFFYWDDEEVPIKWAFEYGKDLTGISVQKDISAVSRWVRPKGYNGIAMSTNYTHASGLAQGGGVWSPDTVTEILSDRALFSPKKEVVFDNVKMRADVSPDENTAGLIICDNQTQVNVGLYNECIKMYNKEKIDRPTITIDIDVVDLSGNIEVREDIRATFKNDVNLLDKVRVQSEVHCLDVETIVKGITYDCIAMKNTKLSLSNSDYDFFKLLNYNIDVSRGIYSNRF